MRNNGLGMVGFVKECIGADPDFEVRMEREKMIQEITERRKTNQQNPRCN